MKIGDLFLRVLADDAGFQADLVKEAEKAGDAAGKTLGQRMGAGIKANGAEIIGTTLAAGFGLATKGLLELEQVTADFAAATGASADEADRAGKAINAMAGRNLQPVTEIGEALTKVNTDLGLSGEEAERTTERFLRFARATKQNAATAVLAFDDILDAWGLTAADAGDIMDKLVVSSQEYGGSISDNQRALAELAPALRAANLTVDDGVGLLNLFAASGVDSGVAVTGMTKALTKVKSPEELKLLIADIIATEDPFLRAEKAADLFGVRAGAKLANVLKPGIGGLEDFAVSTDEAAGATEDAAAVLDSTWGARFQLLMKGATSAITGFGANFGPALTGMASLASLGASLGGGRLVGAIGGGLAGVWRKVAATPIVAKAIAFAGGKAATLYLASLIAGDAIGGALTNAWAKVAASGPVSAATAKAGTFLGTTVGKAFSVAFAAAATIGIVLALKEIGTGAKEEFDKALFGEDRAARAKEFERILREEGMAAATAYVEGLSKGGGLTGRFREGIAGLPATVAAEMTTGAPTVAAGAVQMAMGIPAAVEKMRALAAAAAAQTPSAIAAALREKRDLVSAAMGELRDAMLNEMSPAKERARLIADLTGDELAKGLRSKDPIVRAAAENARQVMLARLAELVPDSGKIGKRQGAELAAALKSKDPQVRAAAQAIKATIERKLAETKAREAGIAVGKGVGAGIGTTNTLVGAAAQRLAIIIGKRLLSGLKTSVGGNVGGTFVGDPRRHSGGPVTAGRPYVVGRTGAEELFIPGVSGRVAAIPEIRAAVAGGGKVGGDTSITIYNPEPRAADDDIGRVLRRVGALGMTGR